MAPLARVGRIVFLILLLLAACAAVPQEPLKLQISAFREAREAAAGVYLLLDADIAEEAEAPSCVAPPSPPPCFSPNAGAPAAPRSPDVAARLAALDAVLAFGETMLGLASGASAETLAADLDGFAGAARSLTTLLAPGSSVAVLAGVPLDRLRELILLAEEARANAQVRAAFAEQRGTIDQVTELLIADTPTVYDIFRASRLQAALELRRQGRPLEEQRAERDRSAAFHDALTAYVALLREAQAANAALAAAFAQGAGVAGLQESVERAIAIRVAAERLAAALDGAGRGNAR